MERFQDTRSYKGIVGVPVVSLVVDSKDRFQIFMVFKTWVSSISRVLFRRTAVRRIMGVDRGTEKNHG